MRFKFQPGQYLQLKSILPALQNHGVQGIEYHPDGSTVRFFGDPLAAAESAFKNGDMSNESVSFIHGLCHPNNRI